MSIYVRIHTIGGQFALGLRALGRLAPAARAHRGYASKSQSNSHSNSPSNSQRGRDGITLPWVWPSDITSRNTERFRWNSIPGNTLLGRLGRKLAKYQIGIIGDRFFKTSDHSQYAAAIMPRMVPLVLSKVVDAVNAGDGAALDQIMTPALATAYKRGMQGMAADGYSIDIQVGQGDVVVDGFAVKMGSPEAFDRQVPVEQRLKNYYYNGVDYHIFGSEIQSLADMSLVEKMGFMGGWVQVEFWCSITADTKVVLTHKGKVVDQDQKTQPISVSLASPAYKIDPRSLPPYLELDGSVVYTQNNVAPFEWRVSDLFLQLSNPEIIKLANACNGKETVAI
ncbi:hypothetical protein IWW55_003393 [Coemansia sp. RSA 2706]|nr:hypothetical protein LPJ63_002172 [Coemansia sp. RSA 2711]KAJ2302502.1 hypothetical protein IWW55_003393 [Coemansia sp. RSA 2706]